MKSCRFLNKNDTFALEISTPPGHHVLSFANLLLGRTFTHPVVSGICIYSPYLAKQAKRLKLLGDSIFSRENKPFKLFFSGSIG